MAASPHWSSDVTANADRFRGFRIHADGGHRAGIESLTLADLTPGEVVIRAAYSSVNYKDALAGTGTGKILRRFPLVGGIDVAGHVVASTDARFREGDAVLCTGSGLSETRDGGYSEIVRLQADWTIPLPAGLDLREAMILGTAGFTAGLSLLRMEQNGQVPDQGPVVVTGATGGVGSLALAILARAGYEAHAISGKAEHADWLRGLGAREVFPRDTLADATRPLENARWAGAIDNVGDPALAALTRLIQPYGNIASCGLAGGAGLATTVMPFIIRGVSLLGIASAGTARGQREQVWERLAGAWKPAGLAAICTRECPLDDLPSVFPGMLAGGSVGRTVVRF
jgi:acrylyl-CoA reductase (NADPH)